MDKPDDNKVKSITFLVRSLVVITMTTLVLVFVLLCVAFSEKKPLVCGVKNTEFTAPCGDNTGSKNYMVNGKDGRALFKANCSSCHTMTDKPSTGPGLKGALDRIPGGDWKYHFIRNSDSMVKAGDAYARMLFEKYKSNCTRFPKLTNEEIDAILSYTSVSSSSVAY